MNHILRNVTVVLILFLAIHHQSIAQVTAQFSATPTSGCAPRVVSFTDLSTGNAHTWFWDFGNSQTSTQQNPQRIYKDGGAHDVTLVVCDTIANICDTIFKPGYIVIYDKPIADFTVNDTAGCLPFTANFTDLSVSGSAPIVEWIWEVGGTTGLSSDQNPSTTYFTPDSITVTLIVRDSFGCANFITRDNYIKLWDYPVANFGSPNPSGCSAPDTVSFTNSSQGDWPLSYFWDFGNGQTSTDSLPTAVYAQNGCYDVTLIATNQGGCADTITRNNFVCIDSLYANFGYNKDSVCVGGTVTYADSSVGTPTGWAWTFPGGSPSTSSARTPMVTYNTPGMKSATLTATYANGCSATITKSNIIIVLANPTAAFTADDSLACAAPLTVNFTNASTGAVSWLWNFGAGQGTSNQQNPSHTYNGPGTYTVSLTVTNTAGCSHTVTKTNLVRIVEPTALFNFDPDKGCVPLTVNFRDSSIVAAGDNIISWVWDFDDGTGPGSGANVTYTYTTPGVYSPTLTITTASGCTATVTAANPIEVGAIPTADFTANQTTICWGESVQFTDQSTNAVDWTWDFGPPGFRFDQNPLVDYDTCGTFDVRLIISSGGDCRDTLTKPGYITVLCPKPKFSYTSVCDSALQVSFTNESTGGHLFNWDFGDTNTSTVEDPVHNYAASGVYTVTLTVTDTMNGCVVTTSENIDVSASGADFTVSDTFICRGETVTFTNTSPSVGTTTWFVNGSSIGTGATRSRSFLQAGDYTVRMINCHSSGCCDTVTRVTYIKVRGLVPNFTADVTQGCLPLTVNFTDLTVPNFSSIASWKWYFGDGDSSSLQNPTHTYTKVQSYNVRLVVTDTFGCTWDLAANGYIRVQDVTANFILGSPVYCVGQTAFVSSTSTPVAIGGNWDMGDGKVYVSRTMLTHIYNYADTFNIQLSVTDNFGCTDTIVKQIIIEDPKVDFTASDTLGNCPPFLVHFNDTVFASDSVVSWMWDFGDGTNSDLEDPSHIYTEPGDYTVTLQVEFASGCTDSLTIPNYIHLLGPTGNLTYTIDSGCIPIDVCFNANSSNSVTCVYDFGDGFLEFSCDTVCHTYNDVGTFIPSVLLTDSTGCDNLVVGFDTLVIDTPYANFGLSPSIGCERANVTFVDSSISKVDIISYHWDFGDGTSDTVQNPVHLYAVTGNFDVTLTILNEHGCVDSITKTVFIYPRPVADFTVSDSIGCEPLPVGFFDNSTADTTIQSLLWLFGDGNTATGPNVSNNYVNDSNYVARLIVTDVRGCADTAFQAINVLARPVGILTGDTAICIGDTVQLIASSGDSIYTWTPSQGLSDPSIYNPLAAPTITTTYTLNVTAPNTCPTTDSVTITVNPIPSLTVSPDTAICYGDSAQLSAQSATGINFQWTPVTGLNNPLIATPKAGPLQTITYQVRTTDSIGCANRDTVVVTVNRAIAIFTEPVACDGDSVNFTDQSIVIGGTISSWDWDFGDSFGSSQQNPVHLYATTGTYNVTLSIQDSNGCMDDTTLQVTVDPLPVASFTPPNTICQNNPASFTDLSSSAAGIASWSWDFGDGIGTSSDQNPTYSYPDTGIYTVTLTVVDNNMCTNSMSVVISVSKQPLANFTAPNACFGDSIQFTDLSSSDVGIVSYVWDFGDASNSTLQNPVHYYNQPGTYPVELRVINANGCFHDTVINVVVYQPPTANFTAYDVCLGDISEYVSASQEGDGSINSQIWLYEDSLTRPGDRLFLLYSDSGNYDVSLYVTDDNGCVDSLTKTIRVDWPPSAFANPDTLICQGQSVQLAGGGGEVLIWEPAEGLSDPLAPNPVATPEVTTVYSLLATNGVCPFDTADIIIEVVPLPMVETIEDRSLPRGAPVELATFIDAGVSITWSPEDYLSCVNCADPVARPEENMLYTVTVTDEFGCVNSDSVLLSVVDRCDEDLIFVANAFTPNGDGINDEAFARELGVKELKNFRIFDRWGKLMFETSNFNVGWGGFSPNGKKLNSGVYVYVVEAVCYNNKTLIKKGNITLLK